MASAISRMIQGLMQRPAQSVVQAELRPQSMSSPQFHLRMHLTEPLPVSEDQNHDPWREVQVLEAGKVYWLHVLLDPDSDNRSTQKPLTLCSDIVLHLICSNSQVQIIGDTVQVVRGSARQGDRFTFQIQVDPFYTPTSVELNLEYSRVNGGGRVLVSNLKLGMVDGEVVETLPFHYVVLDATPGEPARIVHVQSISPLILRIRSYWNEKLEFEIDIEKPALTPSRFIENQHHPRQIINQIKVKSADNPVRFSRWLKSNLRRYADNFCLVICDDSDESDMAWEWIHLYVGEDEDLPVDSELRGQVPIGALVTIVRWIPGLHWYDISHTLTVADRVVQGSVLSYLNHLELDGTQIEKDILATCAGEHLEDTDSLHQRLHTLTGDTALIYLGCHGVIVQDDHEKDYMLGMLDPSRQISVYNFAGLPYLKELAERPIAFVNACHSAWIFRQHGMRYGLPNAFLKQIVQDYIGTIGPVGERRAAHFAEAFLSKVRQSKDGVVLARLLRDLRAEAVRYIRLHETEDAAWFDYLYTFMYVYYGNPYTRLRLNPAEDSSEGAQS